ncbi:MAG: DUF2232 domain-containing protein [Gemmatimonadaceae bacterium]|nr:DUF2232 domain-containing protein [Gemmatimonadaceae bacterium]
MTQPAVAEPAAVPSPREQGWGKVALATLALLLVPLTPLLRVLLPVDRTALLLAPALAAVSVAGWMAGGRGALAVAWTAVAAWSVSQLSGAGLFSLLQAGWALLVAGIFGAGVAFRRAHPEPMLTQALRAIGIATAVSLVVTAAVPGGPGRVANAVAAEAGSRADESRTAWREMTSRAEWKDFVAQNPQAGEMAKAVDAQLASLPVTARTLFPALAALEALGALAVAWALYHRIGRSRIGPPLGRLREFRFNDHMVWGVVGGLALVLIPGFAAARAVGANLLLFFGALYTIRGAGVFLWMVSPGRLASAFLVIVAVLFWNVLGVMALGLGVGDTWLDWRARARARKT